MKRRNQDLPLVTGGLCVLCYYCSNLPTFSYVNYVNIFTSSVNVLVGLYIGVSPLRMVRLQFGEMPHRWNEP